ncbi:hypothetical protein Dimus_017785 [Dionaea muscipula]
MNPSPMAAVSGFGGGGGGGSGWNNHGGDGVAVVGGKVFDDRDMMIGALLLSPSKVGTEKKMLQNCDLPPPNKVFPGPENEKLELLKALRLSQTRAREAETKYAAVAKERDSLTRVFLWDSIKVFGYRQLVSLLELQVSNLHAEVEQKRHSTGGCDCGVGVGAGAAKKTMAAEPGDGGGGGGLTWVMTLAFCLGFAGLGLAFGCKFFF